MKKTLFLDRDGIVNIDTEYLYKPKHVEFIDGIFDLCQKAQDLGYLIIIVTNQSGIARGYYSEDDVEILHDWMKDEFADRGVNITEIFISTYHPESITKKYLVGHNDRKPKPGMFFKAQEKFNIDFSKSLMVGDKPSDRIEIPELKCIILKSQYSVDDKDGFDVEKLVEIIPFL